MKPMKPMKHMKPMQPMQAMTPIQPMKPMQQIAHVQGLSESVPTSITIFWFFNFISFEFRISIFDICL